MSTLVERYSIVRERIANAAGRVGRDPGQVKLIAVSKGRPLPAILELHNLGQRDFGENRIEEASDKISATRSEPRVVWHMIGHIQSRKAKVVAMAVDWVHSVDSTALAEKLNRHAVRPLPILLECNLSGEEAKYGFSADHFDSDPAQWESLCLAVESIRPLSQLQLLGLMTMAPVVAEPEQARSTFRRLRQLRDRLAARWPAVDWRELSMGMTDDFEVAIEEGATIVRVGRAIFEEV